MRPAFYHILCLLLLSHAAFAQSVIHGRILNEAGDDPIPGASIYFNNTSSGTSSGTNGEFSLAVPAFANPELIVSSVGFEVIVFKLTPQDDLRKNYIFKLKAKQQMLQNVLVLPDATRRKYLKIFKDNFLGLTQEADESTIKNIDAVYFTQAPGDKNTLYAYADSPLLIINKMLGYRIHFDLQEFTFNEKSGFTSFYGFTRYEEMGDKKKWIKRRRQAYYGSTMHFFRSLIANRLEEEAYKIFVVRTDTIRKPDGGQKLMDVAIPTTAAQIMRKDSSGQHRHIAVFKHKLMIQYGADPATKAWLTKHVFAEGTLPRGYRAYITLENDYLEIDNNGILLNPMDVLFSGYWIYEKAANLLPFDYVP